MLKSSDGKTLHYYVFFATVWIFYSLNSRPDFRIPYPDIWRWVLLAILVLTVVFTFDDFSLSPPKIVFFFVLGVTPSLLTSVAKSESLTKFLSFFAVVWGFYIYFSSLKSKEDLEIALKIAMFVMIAFEIQSIIFIAIGNGYGGSRALGVTTNSNTLGIYSNVSFLAAYYFSKNSKSLKKLFFFAIMIISVYTAFASGSRAAFVCIVVSISLIMYLQTKGSFLNVLIMVAIVVIGFLTINGFFSFLNIEALNRLTAEGGSDRGAIWEKGISVWREHPIFGCGYAVSRYLNDSIGEEMYVFHNSYISILAETGLWGAIVIGISAIKELVIDIQALLRNKKSWNFSLIVCCLMMITMLLNAYTESFLFAVGSTEACTFWMLFIWSLVYREKIIVNNDSE